MHGLDDFRAGRPDAPEHLGVPFHVLDAGDEEAVFSPAARRIFRLCSILRRMCMSAASVREPIPTWENNVGTTTRLLSAVRRAGVPKFVFSTRARCLVILALPLFARMTPFAP